MSDHHEFGPDGLCLKCGQRECGDAFWRAVAIGLGKEPPPDGTNCLRLRPDKEPEFLKPGGRP